MSADDILLNHLRTIAAQTSWREVALRAQITRSVFRVLDLKGWIEFQVWKYVDPHPFQNPDPSRLVPVPIDNIGWFSPYREPFAAGTLDEMLDKYSADAKLSPEVRVSETGKAKLAEVDIGRCGGPRLDEIPPFDKSSGAWIKAAAAAHIEVVETASLRSYRSVGQAADDGLSGVDPAGRMWRKLTRNAQAWYLKSSLKNR